MLSYDLYGEIIFKQVNVRILPDFLYEALLNLESGVVGVVKNTEFGVAALAVKIEASVFLAVEIDSPFKELTYLFGGARNHFSHGVGITEPVTGDHRVVNMFFEVIDFEVGNRSYAALRERGIGLIYTGFAYQSHL